MAKAVDLSGYDYAHRGLWNPEGPVENTREAIMAAAEAGFGIEFDVRPLRDGTPVLFHDRTTNRLCDEKQSIEDLSLESFLSLNLRQKGNLLSLQELLDLWPGKTPLLCELKIDGRTDPVTFANTVSVMLEAYNGPAAAMSFSLIAVASLSNRLTKGQLLAPSSESGLKAFSDSLALCRRPHADYIACHTCDVERIIKTEPPLPVCVWTVRNVDTYRYLKPLVSAQIFEGFDPRQITQTHG